MASRISDRFHGESGLRQRWLFLATLLFLPGAHAETCGLQNVVYDSIFEHDFDPPSAPVLGPPLSTVSAPLLGVAPTLAVTYPAAGAVIETDKTVVTGTYTGPAATGISVQGLPAYLVGNTFFAPGITLQPGSNTFAVKATTLDGLTAETSLTITRAATVQPLTLSTTAALGPKPFRVSFLTRLTAPTTIASLSLDFGDGSAPFVGAPDSLPSHTYTTPGIYTATATATGANGLSYTAATRVGIGSIPQQREILCSVYAHLRARLQANDRAGALVAFTGPAKRRYEPYFTTVGAALPGLANKLGTIAGGQIAPAFAEMTVVTAVNGAWRGNALVFSQGADGVWRIDGL